MQLDHVDVVGTDTCLRVGGGRGALRAGGLAVGPVASGHQRRGKDPHRVSVQALQAARGGQHQRSGAVADR